MYVYESNEIYIHSVNQYTIIDLFSQVGGLLGIYSGIIFAVIRYLNYKLILE